MKTIAILPARMGSSRFPGKPMAKILGMPMIGHVWNRCRLARSVDETFVATCDDEIKSYIEGLGGKAIMTAETHERCSDRTAEALLKAEESLGWKAECVLMLQGDEPMVTPAMIEEALAPFRRPQPPKVVNLMAEIRNDAEHLDPNEVKVVVDRANDALYFSREAIPSATKVATPAPRYKQVCVIPFARDFLLDFNALEPTPLEMKESVDMLRVLEHGEKVHMVRTEAKTVAVDTPEDLKRVEILLKEDPLVSDYLATAH